MTVTRRGAQSQGEEAQPHPPQTQGAAAIDVDMEGPQNLPAPDTLQPPEGGDEAQPVPGSPTGPREGIEAQPDSPIARDRPQGEDRTAPEPQPVIDPVTGQTISYARLLIKWNEVQASIKAQRKMMETFEDVFPEWKTTPRPRRTGEPSGPSAPVPPLDTRSDEMQGIHPGRQEWFRQQAPYQATGQAQATGPTPPAQQASPRPSQGDLHSLAFDIRQKLSSGAALTGQERAALSAVLEDQLGRPAEPSPTRSVQGVASPPPTSRIDVELLFTQRAQPPVYFMPPAMSGALASGQRANQSQLFLAAQARNGGSWIRETPFDLGAGTRRLKGTETLGFPGIWPRSGHDPLNISHHFYHWMVELCRWGRRLQASPAMVIEFAIDHLFDTQARITLRSRTESLDFQKSTALEEFYEIVLDIGLALDAVARPEKTLHEFMHARIRDDEDIISFYVRLLNSLSLMLNSPHATPTCDANQLMVVFVMGIADRPLAHTHLVQTMDFHPRQQYMLYEPWDLVWANYQASTSPPQVRPVPPTGGPRLHSQVAAYDAVYVDPSGQGRGRSDAVRGQKRARGHSPRPGPGHSPRGFQPTGSNRTPIGGSSPGQGRTPDSPQGPRSKHQKATRREALADSVPAFQTLPQELQTILKDLRRVCIAPEHRDVPTAQLPEIPDVRAQHTLFKVEASRAQVPPAFCFACKYWGHPTNSAVCRAGSKGGPA